MLRGATLCLCTVALCCLSAGCREAGPESPAGPREPPDAWVAEQLEQRLSALSQKYPLTAEEAQRYKEVIAGLGEEWDSADLATCKVFRDHLGQALPVINEVLRTGDAGLRKRAARCLPGLGNSEPLIYQAVVLMLLPSTTDPVPGVRRVAASQFASALVQDRRRSRAGIELLTPELRTRAMAHSRACAETPTRVYVTLWRFGFIAWGRDRRPRAASADDSSLGCERGRGE